MSVVVEAEILLSKLYQKAERKKLRSIDEELRKRSFKAHIAKAGMPNFRRAKERELLIMQQELRGELPIVEMHRCDCLIHSQFREPKGRGHALNYKFNGIEE